MYKCPDLYLELRDGWNVQFDLNRWKTTSYIWPGRSKKKGLDILFSSALPPDYSFVQDGSMTISCTHFVWYLNTYPVLATATHQRHQSKPHYNQRKIPLKKKIGNVIKLGGQRLLIANIIHLHNYKEFMLPKLILLVFN